MFSEKGNLTGHERTHTGKTSFVCNFCEKRFSEKRGLTKYERIHTSEKTFTCKVCMKGFSLKNCMSVYILERSHSNVNFVRKDFLKKDT